MGKLGLLQLNYSIGVCGFLNYLVLLWYMVWFLSWIMSSSERKMRKTEINCANGCEEDWVLDLRDDVCAAKLLQLLKREVFRRYLKSEPNLFRVRSYLPASGYFSCALVTMGSYTNFKNLGDTSQLDGRPPVNLPLARQSSIYSLTFDEFQNTLGGPGKDFGSMNMEDLLKSIWTAEESQAFQASMVGANGSASGGNLQRQGSLTLPRTLSQKTVDEVWRDVLKETTGFNGEGSSLGQREPTLGEMTLEDFLFKAGVVREDVQPALRSNGQYIYGASNGNASGFTGFQPQPSQNNVMLTGQQADKNSVILNSANVGINMSSATVTTSPQQPQLQPLFPKQTTVTFSSQTQIGGSNSQLSSSVAKGPIVGTKNVVNNNSTMVQGGPAVLGAGLNNGTMVASGSPVSNLYADTVVKSCADTSPSVSPSPYNFGEVGKGRRSNSSLEKVVERRRRRMIKNRESAARSRARKQEELMEMQKNELLEKMNKPWGEKRMCLRRTLTGPWLQIQIECLAVYYCCHSYNFYVSICVACVCFSVPWRADVDFLSSSLE
ncbi:abscisic acid responsive elements-binding factor3 [Striga asiatica]|uniref:Abscisic acid responsive elements-binding factor3 n=1 Tax=Striga asiatica TaxID=4170 RepID=A0A5A7RHG7_STRAF|nr:abscisic acid responsive elements-binding factor3 [Striga asiatica]